MRFRPALQSLHTRDLNAYFTRYQMNGLEKDRLITELQAYLQEKPRTNVELRTKIAEMTPSMGERLLYMVRIFLPLIQTFPGGAWGVGGSPAYTEASAWLGRSFASPEAGLRSLILSYLAAFGPASVKDLQIWSGVPRLAPAGFGKTTLLAQWLAERRTVVARLSLEAEDVVLVIEDRCSLVERFHSHSVFLSIEDKLSLSPQLYSSRVSSIFE